MKSTVTLIVIACMVIVCSVPVRSQELKINDKTKKYTAENSIVIDSMSKDTLFKRTLKWLYKEYPNTGKKRTYINAVSGKILTHQFFNPEKGIIKGYTNLRIGFLLTLEFSDNKINYNYTDFYYFSSGHGKVPFDSSRFLKYDLLIRDRMLDEANKYVKKSIPDLTTYLQKSKVKAKGKVAGNRHRLH